VIAFNGSPAQQGFYQLEAMQWRPKTRSFHLRRFDFPTPSDADQKVKISRKNPKACLGCHKSDPRPNWEPYAHWPGAYAGADDVLSADGETLNKKFASFLERAPKDGRYAHLIDLAETYALAPGGRTKVQHNIRLSTLFSQLNYQRVARLMESTPNFARHRYETLEILAGCKSLSIERSEALLQSFETRGIDVQHWSMSFRGNHYGMTSPNSWAGELLARVLERQADLAPLFWRFTGYYGFPQAQALQGDEEGTCGPLREAMKQNVDGL
jgi:hypothetical protein